MFFLFGFCKTDMKMQAEYQSLLISGILLKKY